MNQNEIDRQQKEVGIRAAINALFKIGVENLNNKKLIAAKTRELFPDNPKKQISQNSLSNPYYQKRIPELILEETRLRNPSIKKAQKEAVKTKQKNLKKKYLLLEILCRKLALSIKEGTLVPDKPIPTKKFLSNWLQEQMRQKIIDENKNSDGKLSINLSMPQYKGLYSTFLNELQKGNSENTQSNKVVEKFKYERVKRDLIIKENEYKNLVRHFFINSGSQDKNDPFISGDGFEKLATIEVDIRQLKHSLEEIILPYKKQKRVNAYQLIKIIIEKCEAD
ncbi:hypothetical protein AB9M93_25315 [Peribacillus frigoritolerans]|uniref:hypothetical protein n=1 Tax=Peribacillus frigoritolerans TaxID=450367 RepID=UPI003513D9E2